MNALSGKLGRRSLESFVWRILGTVCLFFMHAILGRILRPEDYGLFSFTLSVVAVLALLSTLGWPKALVRLISQYTVEREWRLLKGALVSSHQHSLLMSVLFSALLLASASVVADTQRSQALYYAALLLPVRSLITLRRSLFQGLHNVRGSILPDEILLPGMMIAGLLLYGTLSLTGVVLLYFVIICSVFAATLVWVWRILPGDLAVVSPSYKSEAWLRLAIPLLLGGLAQVVLGQSGVFLLGMNGDMAGAGLFSASARIALFVTFVMTAVNVIGMPMMAAALQEKNKSELRLLYRKSRFWSVLGALPVFILLVSLPEQILGIFGPEFISGALMLMVLALGQLCNAAVGLAGSLLVVSGEEKYFMNSMVVVTVLCVLLMLWVIPVWGATGAATVYSGSLAALSLAQLYRANRIAN